MRNIHNIQIFRENTITRYPSEYPQGKDNNRRGTCRQPIYTIGKVSSIGYGSDDKNDYRNKNQPYPVLVILSYPLNQGGIVKLVILHKGNGRLSGFHLSHFRERASLLYLCDT